MTKIAAEYERYQASSLMKKLAKIAHGESFIGQTSSATYDEIVSCIDTKYISPKSTVLDAGCGNGAFSIPLSLDFQVRIEGVDLSAELIHEASLNSLSANLSDKCNFSVGDFTILPNHSDSFFDLIICIGSLYWGQSLSTTFATWKRVMKPHGQLLLFLNLQYKPLSLDEKKDIGATQFIPAVTLEEELAKNGYALSEWSDKTECYIAWLERWCLAMNEIKEDLIAEMGEASTMQLIRRFMMYYNLAQKNSVRRIILKAEYV